MEWAIFRSIAAVTAAIDLVRKADPDMIYSWCRHEHIRTCAITVQIYSIAHVSSATFTRETLINIVSNQMKLLRKGCFRQISGVGSSGKGRIVNRDSIPGGRFAYLRQ